MEKTKISHIEHDIALQREDLLLLLLETSSPQLLAGSPIKQIPKDYRLRTAEDFMREFGDIKLADEINYELNARQESYN